MRLCRFDDNRLGLVLGESVADVTQALDHLPARRWPQPKGDNLIAHLATLRPVIAAMAASAKRRKLDELRLLSPVANPTKLIAAPLNYPMHVQEAAGDATIHHGVHRPDHEGFATPIDKFGLFLKAASSLVGPSEGVEIVFPDRRNDHEVELAVIIGETCRHVREAEARSKIAGYAIGLDMTVRGPEDRSFRKSPDGYAVLGPFLVTADEIARPDALDLSITVNGVERQRSNTRELIVGIDQLIVRASRVFTLHPGDVIYTGTPDGVGAVAAGDVMVATIESIGSMRVELR